MPEMVPLPGQQKKVPGKVVDASWGEAGTGTKTLQLIFELGGELKPGLKSLGHDLYITDGTRNRVVEDLRTLGFDIDTASPTDLQRLRENPITLLGMARCSLVCVLEEANQFHREPKWKVKFINSLDSKTTGTVGDPVDFLLSRDKSKDRARQQSPLEAAKAAAEQEEDDSIPF